MRMLPRQIIVCVSSIEKQNNAMEFLPACIASRLAESFIESSVA